MEPDKREVTPARLSHASLFVTFLKINAFTFGGGYTIVPVIRDEFVDRLHLIQEEEMMDLVALAQSAPGPMAINTSILTGYRVLGPLGAITSLVASVLPCLVIISLLFYVYTWVSKNPWVQAAFDVMGGSISAILVLTTWSMGKASLKQHKVFGIVLMILSFCAAYFFEINTALIIFLSGMIGLLVFQLIEERKVM